MNLENASRGRPSTPITGGAFSAEKPPAARLRPLADVVVDVVGAVASCNGACVDRCDLRRTTEQVLRACGQGQTPEALAVVIEVARRVGLELTLESRSCRTVAASPSGPLPQVTIVDGPGGAYAIAVLDIGRRVHVEEPGFELSARELSAEELAATLGVGPDAEVAWLSARGGMTLDGLRAGEPAGHGADGEHPTPFRRLKALAALERDDVWMVVVFAVGVGLLSLATPLGVQMLVNTVAFGALAQPLAVLTLLVLVGLACAGMLRAMQAWVVERMQERIFARATLDLTARLPRVHASAYDAELGPELVNRFFDVVIVQKSAAAVVIDGVSIALQTVLGMVLLGLYHPFLLGFTAILTAGIAIIVFPLGRGATKTAVKESKAKHAVAAWLEELARHRTVFRTRTGSQVASTRTHDLTATWLEARREHFRVLFRQIVGTLVLQAVASAALLGIGGLLVIQRQLTLGQLVAAELIVSAVVAGLTKLGKTFESYYDLLAAIDKVGHLVDLPLESAAGEVHSAAGRGAALKVAGVTFAAAGARVRCEAFEVAPGERVLVTGAGGAGKTLLAEGLFGLRPPAPGGTLELDGTAMRHLALESLREHVHLVGGAEVFAGTIVENVVAAGPGASGREVELALRIVGLTPVVARLRDGLQTRLLPGGTPLSETEAMQLTLARAIVARPRLLVVDGAFDLLDDDVLTSILEALDDLGASVVVFSRTRTALPRARRYHLAAGVLRPVALESDREAS